MNSFKRLVMASVLGALTLGSAMAASNNSSDVLRYISEDTPYLFASTKPMPDDLADKIEPTVDKMLKAYQQVARHIVEEQVAKMTAEGASTEDIERLDGLANEMISFLSLESLRGAGIDRDSAFAIYGNGLLPVLRLELSKSGLFDSAIERIEEKADKPMEKGEAEGENYKYIGNDKMRLLIATIDSQAIVTVVPSAFDEEQVAAALGINAPRKSLKRSREVRNIQKQYGYGEQLLGFVDIKRIAGVFTGGGNDQDVALFSALGEELPEISPVCSTEFMQLAGIAPRMVFGYSELSADSIKGSVVVEMREDLANGLVSLPAAVPGLGVDHGSLLSFGMSLNPLALRDFYEARIDAMEETPYECEKLADLQAGAAKGREALNQPIPPVVYSFRGFVANVEDIQGLDLATKTPPSSVDASMLVAMENAQALLMMAAMMDPQIAALNLLPDGKPVKLEMAQLAELADEAFAAMSPNGLSIAVGENSETNSANMLSADGKDPAPFVSINFDAERYYSMVGAAMEENVGSDESAPTPPAVQEAMQEIVELTGSLYDRMSVDVQFTERGVEIVSEAQLGE